MNMQYLLYFQSSLITYRNPVWSENHLERENMGIQQESLPQRTFMLCRAVQSITSKVAKVVTTEHSYANKRINVEKLQTYKKQVKALKQQVRRKNKKIKNMEELLKLLKKEKLLLDDQCSLLEHNFSCVAEQLFQNEMRNAANTSYGHRYTDEIKQFAVTLHYYSPKAYEYVQKILALPHTSSLRAWAASVDCNPGYLMNVIRCLGTRTSKEALDVWCSSHCRCNGITQRYNMGSEDQTIYWDCWLWYSNARGNRRFSNRSFSIYDIRNNRTL